jgi:hypothetical protein
MDVMIDIETLSTKPEAVVLSVGAVKFNMHDEPVEKIHWRLSIDEQTEADRDISDDTLEWWSKQALAVRAEVFSEDNRISVPEFFKELNRYVTGCDKIWCQGPQFDLVIIENLYRQFEHHWSWQYWQVMDSRTLFQVMKHFNFEDPRKGVQQDLHNAAEDAYWQAIGVQKMYSAIGKNL